MMKRIIISTIALLLIFGFLQAISNSVFALEQEETFKLRVHSPYPTPDTSLASRHVELWEELVTERTNGAVTFENFYGGTLGTTSETLDICSSGVADVVVTYGWYTVSKLPLIDYDYAFPFGPTDPYILTKAMRQIYEEFPEFEEELNRNNVARLFQTPGITEMFLSKEPITGFEYFEGKKCKAIGRYFGRWIEALGATPVSAAGTEVYTMMQTGVIDMAMDTGDLLFSGNVHEQAPHCMHPELLTTNWIAGLINLDTLNSMPEELQKILLRTGVEVELRAALEVNPKWEERIFSEWEALPDYTFQYMSDEDRMKWAERMPNTAAEWADDVTEQGYPGWEILNRYMELTEQMGHVWIRDWSQR